MNERKEPIVNIFVRRAVVLFILSASTLLPAATISITTTVLQETFYGLGGNYCFRTNNPMTERTLSELRVTYGRIDANLRTWEPQNDNGDPNTPNWTYYRAQITPGSQMERTLQLMRRFKQDMNIPVNVAVWWLPSFIQPGGSGTSVPRDNWPEMLECIGTYLLYAKNEWQAEADYFSFNECDMSGGFVYFSATDHRDFIKACGPYLASLGLRTKLLLGDVSNPNRPGTPYCTPTINDPVAMQYVGMLSYHSYEWESGSTYDNALIAWGNLARSLRIPYMCGEMADSDRTNLGDLEHMMKVLVLSNPQYALWWQYTEVGNELSLGDMVGNTLVVRPRFYYLKQLGNLSPVEARQLQVNCSRPRSEMMAVYYINQTSVSVHIANFLQSDEPVNIMGLPQQLTSLQRMLSNQTTQYVQYPAVAVANGSVGFTVPARSLMSAYGVYAASSPVNAPPTVSLTSPVSGSTYTAPATVALAATASDPDGTIARVEFWTSTTLLGTDTASPYAYTWTGVGAGSYALRAIAYDNQNATSTSTVVNITVYSSGTPANQPPTINLTSPVSGSTYTAPATIQLTATATDPDGSVSTVRFYSGATLLNTDTASPWTFMWAGVSSGTYQLRAVAQDNQGATSTSTVVTVTVLSSSTPAVWYTLTATVNPANGGTVIPASGTYLAGSQIQVTATPNANYTFATWSGDASGTNPTVTLTMDSDKSITANFTYVPPANSSPVVSIISPPNGATLTAPTSITITATATDTDGTITAVRFYHGTTLLATDSTSPYEYTWTGVPAGSYVLTARAEDNGGAVGTSPAVTVTVNPETQPPQPQQELKPGEVRIVGGLDGYINATTNPNVVIRFRRTSAGVVTVRMYDLRGRLVVEKSKDGIAGIDDDIAWNAVDLPAGVYIVRVKGGGVESSKRVVLVR
jgi:hypothetical protein